MTQKKLQSQVEEEHMSEQNKPEILKMELEALSKNEEFARVAVVVFMARLNPTLEEVDDVKTAVSEAVTNAVIHGYRGEGGIIYIEIAVTGQEISITIRDTGVGIPDIKQAMEPMYTTDPDGERSGMGFSFMEAFMDQVEVLSAPGEGTAVTMKKKISG
jgi:stage II sporulation protein AB (anti-sigma F factor)